MTPATDGERVSVEVRDPEDRERVAETTTEAVGGFDVRMDVAGPAPDETQEEYERRRDGGVIKGTNRVQASTIEAANAVETTSNVVYFKIRADGKVDTEPVREPSHDILAWLDRIEEFIPDLFSRFTGHDGTVRRRRMG